MNDRPCKIFLHVIYFFHNVKENCFLKNSKVTQRTKIIENLSLRTVHTNSELTESCQGFLSTKDGLKVKEPPHFQRVFFTCLQLPAISKREIRLHVQVSLAQHVLQRQLRFTNQPRMFSKVAGECAFIESNWKTRPNCMGTTARGVPPNCPDQNGDIPASAQPNPGLFRLSLSLCQAGEPVTLNPDVWQHLSA